MPSKIDYLRPELLREGPIPLYRQVADAIRDRIRSGRWPGNYKLKAEVDLATELGVSRGTMRQALQSLVQEGLLTQVQGRGTFVRAPKTDLPLAQRLVTMHEILEQTGQSFTIEVLDRKIEPGPERVRSFLDVDSEEKLFQLQRRFVVEGEPFVALTNYVRVKLCPGIGEIDFADHSLFDVLESRYGLEIGWGQRNFAARRAGSLSRLLGADEHEPLLYLEQVTYLSDGVPLEYSDVWVRGEKLRITTLLRR